MGSGKTSYAIQKMNEDNENNYIYITPFLSEIQRIKDSCKTRKFYEPKQMGKGKQDSLHRLIMQNKNIASTHALFQMSTEVTVDLIKANDYILILDEVMNVLKGVDLKKDDLSSLLTLELIIIDEKGIVVWNKEKLDYEGEYDYIKDMALQNTLFYVNNKLFMWTFPTSVFQAFKEVYVMTYMFDSQIQRYYYDLHDLKYEYYYVVNENEKYILKFKGTDYKENRETFKKLINILIDDKINNIGDGDYTLSYNWFNGTKKKVELLKQLKLNIYNYFKRKIEGNSKDNM
jgi:hypothetical protein